MNLDLDQLDQASTPRTSGCLVAATAATLGQDKARFLAIVEDLMRSSEKLSDLLRQSGVAISATAIRRHRRHVCPCAKSQ